MKPIALDEFCKIKSLGNLRFSPSGKLACFVLAEPDKKGNAYHRTLWLCENGKTRQLTSGGKEGNGLWLDDETVIFAGNREEKSEESLETKYYKINVHGGEATLAFTVPMPVEDIHPLGKDEFAVLCSSFPGHDDLYLGDEKKIKAYFDETKANADYEEIKQIPWWWNGGTFTHAGYSTLYLFHRKTGKLERLTNPGESVGELTVSPDKKTLYYAKSDAAAAVLNWANGETLYAYDLESKSERKIAESKKDFVIQFFAAADGFLILNAHNGKYGMNMDGDFFRLDPKTGEISHFCAFGKAVGSSVGTDVRLAGGYSMKIEGNALYAITTDYDKAGIVKIEENKVTEVLMKDGSVDCFDVKDGKILAVALYDMLPQELYDGAGKRLTSFNAQVCKNKYIAKPEELFFTTAGHEIHGFVMKPFGYEEGKKYPCILDVHGGPKTVYGKVYYHEMQYWAGLGYFVVYCNPTGSDGRGNEFMDIRGKYGTVDYDDVMAFCDEALARCPDIDPKNFFETGGSYGGFMTNWIVGHTDRFTACASQRSISNWVSFMGNSDIGYSFGIDQNAGTIWPSPEKLWWHSPLKYADRVKTPTLFIHSFEDYRCPIEQGYQMYSAIAQQGVETKMVCFKGENHDLSRTGKPLHRIKRLDEITKWFEGHKKA